MMRIHEHGLQDRENNLLYTKKPKCSTGGGKFITVGLYDVKPALLLLAAGFVLAIILLFFEIFLAYLQIKITNKF